MSKQLKPIQSVGSYVEVNFPDHLQLGQIFVCVFLLNIPAYDDVPIIKVNINTTIRILRIFYHPLVLQHSSPRIRRIGTLHIFSHFSNYFNITVVLCFGLKYFSWDNFFIYLKTYFIFLTTFVYPLNCLFASYKL